MLETARWITPSAGDGKACPRVFCSPDKMMGRNLKTGPFVGPGRGNPAESVHHPGTGLPQKPRSTRRQPVPRIAAMHFKDASDSALDRTKVTYETRIRSTLSHSRWLQRLRPRCRS